MSSNTTAIDQEAIAGLQENVTINYIYAVLAALVAYEFLITINQEISMAWQRKPTGATWLFMINRYLMLVTGVLGGPFPGLEVRLPWMSSHHQHGAVVDTSNSCAGVFVVSALMFSQFIVFAMFSALRIYAVWDRSLPLFVVVFALNLVPLATNLYTAIITSYENVNYPLLGTICGGSTNLSWGVFFGLIVLFSAALGTRLALIIADLLVVVLTWVKTWETRRLASEAGIQVPLITLLLRDGTVYFIALLAMNVGQIVIENVHVSLFEWIGSTSIFINIFPPILISRFLYNLRQASDYNREIESGTFSIPGFRTPSNFIGNLGEPLRCGPDLGTPLDSLEEPSDINMDTSSDEIPPARHQTY